MVKKFLMLALVVGACSTTPPPPPSQTEIKGAAVTSYIAETCAQRGWLTNQQAVAAMVNSWRSVIARAPNQVAVSKAAFAREPVQLHHCRQLEFQAAQYNQQQMVAAQQRAEQAQQDAIAAQRRAANNQQTQQMGTGFQYPIMNLPSPQITMPGSNRVTCTHVGINTICR